MQERFHPLKVICIDNKNPERPHLIKEEDWIFEGDVYTVLTEVPFSTGTYYILAERNFIERPVYYNSRRFLPLTEEDLKEGQFSGKELVY